MSEIEFPLARSAFADILRYAEVTMTLDPQQEISGDGRGRYYAIDQAPPIWRGTIRLDDNLTHAQAAEVQAMIESLDGALNSFMMHDPRLPYPIRDPLGAIIRPWATPITITAIAGNNKEIQVEGMPPHYWLSRGDRLHFNFGENPVHRAYHRIVSTQQAGPGGNSGWFELRPHLVDNAVDLGTVITLDRPCAQWIIPPGQFQAGSGRRMLTAGGTFKIQQVI